MSRIFMAVTIDCECDKGPGWRSRRPLAFKGIQEGVGRRLGPVFRAFGAKPTYLVSPEVLRDAASVSLLAAEAPGAELGTHLHGEYAQPGAHEPAVTVAFQRDYPAEVEEAKMKSLTESFRSAFGRAPKSFRAGRFGIGARTIGLLESLGYEADSSVTPFVSWEDRGARGLSFVGAPTQPYWPSRRCPHARGARRASCVLEVPVTIRPHRLAGLPWLGRFAPPRWLRPTHMTEAALVDVAKEEVKAAREAARGTPVVLNAMLHNVEVIPAASPYAQTERQAERILARLCALLRFASRESIAVVGLADVAAVFADARDEVRRTAAEAFA